MLDALVVGAGPTGLTTALELARRGVATRIIDGAPGPFAGSRGKGITARTQEVFDDLRIVDELLAAGFSHLPMRVTIGGEIRSDGDARAHLVPTADRPYASGYCCRNGGRNRSCGTGWPSSGSTSNTV